MVRDVSPRRTPRRTAMVLSSGGARGAYGVGVMKALLTGASPATGFRALDPDIYTGTSVGAFSAAVMASQPGRSAAASIRRLEALWRQRIAIAPGGCDSGAFRLRGLPAQELHPQCFIPTAERLALFAHDWAYLSREIVDGARRFASLSNLPLPGRILEVTDLTAIFDPSPLAALIREAVSRDALAASGKELAVVASRWKQGTPRVFRKKELVSRGDFLPLMASTAIPGLFPGVELDGELYVDGGLTMNTPLEPAITAGAEVLHVVFLDPVLAESAAGKAATTPNALARLFSVLAAEQIKNDLKTAHNINLAIRLLANDSTVAARIGDRQAPEVLTHVIREHERHRDKPRRFVEIHVYRPAVVLGDSSGLVNFNLDHIDQLIRLGYRDAVNHDCEANGCSEWRAAQERAGAATVYASAGGERTRQL